MCKPDPLAEAQAYISARCSAQKGIPLASVQRLAHLDPVATRRLISDVLSALWIEPETEWDHCRSNQYRILAL